MDILALLVCLEPLLANSSVRQLGLICEAILTMTGPVTMLGISRWTNKGGSYRTVQRFFATNLSWLNILWLFFRYHLYKSDETYLLAGDETIVTKSGKQTHGIERFYCSLYQKPVLGLAFFALSLVGVRQRSAHPVSIEQIVRTSEEKQAAKQRKRKKKKKAKRQSKGRPKGSKNKDRTEFRPTPELSRIDSMIAALLRLIGSFLPLRYLVLDGHFGNNQALLMARKNNLHLISKLRHDAALYEEYEGVYLGHGPHKKYGNKLDARNFKDKYLKKSVTEAEIVTTVYQGIFLHKEFCQSLNVVTIVKQNLKTGAQAHVILFSSDLELGYEQLVEYYRLRFQIEFNFRDAKQHWGLEDFMNVTQAGVTNAANLSFLMVNLSQAILNQRPQIAESVLDLKSYSRALKYVTETIKMLLQKPEPILLEQVIERVSNLGRIHAMEVTTQVT